MIQPAQRPMANDSKRDARQRGSGALDSLFRHDLVKRFPNCFRHPSIDVNGLVQINIQHHCVHGHCVCRVLEQFPGIAPVGHYHLPLHFSDESLLVADLKTGQFKDSPFDRIHKETWLNVWVQVADS